MHGMDPSEASKNKNEDASSSSQRRPESSYPNYPDSLSPIKHPVNANDDLDDFLLGELDPESFGFTPPHLVLTPETETLLFESGIAGGDLLREDPCNNETVHQEEPAYVDELGKIQDVELPSQEWIESNLFADKVLETEPCHDSKAQASQEHRDLIRCLQFEEAASNVLGSNNSPIPAQIPEESVSSAPSSVAEDKRASYLPPRSSTNFPVKPFGLHLNSLIKDTTGVHSETADVGLSEGLGSKRMKHKIVISPGNNGKSMVRVSTINERHETDASVAAADFITSENPCLVEPFNSSSCLAIPHGNKKISATDAENSEKLNQPGPRDKKRPKTTETDTDDFKGCTCKRSACMILYCDCFAADHYCAESCTCQGCLNRPEHRDKVNDIKEKIKSRNPLAFAPTIVQNTSNNTKDDNLKTTSPTHKRDCECRKPKCGENYRDCFEASQEHREEAASNAHGSGSTNSPIPAQIPEEPVSLALSSVAEDIRSAFHFPPRSSRSFTVTPFGLHLNSLINATPPVHSAANDGKSSLHISFTNERHETAASLAAADSVTSENPSLKEPSKSSSCLAIVHDNKKTSATDADNSEKLNQPGPRKKKRPNSTDTDGFKGCSCKKSECMKLYCECFAAEHYCAEPCTCQGCLNRPEHRDKVNDSKENIKSHNPLAFAPKIVQNATDILSNNTENDNLKTTSSARHKRGCKCKKSRCEKKYCECFEVEVGCSSQCLCEGCENPYGKKEDSSVVAVEDLLSKERDSGRAENVSDSSHAELDDNDVHALSSPTPSLPRFGMRQPMLFTPLPNLW